MSMISQGYPLFAIMESGDKFYVEPCLIVGWRVAETGILAYAVTVAGGATFLGKPAFVFLTLQECEQFYDEERGMQGDDRSTWTNVVPRRTV
jgi:hypothetical protein